MKIFPIVWIAVVVDIYSLSLSLSLSLKACAINDSNPRYSLPPHQRYISVVCLGTAGLSVEEEQVSTKEVVKQAAQEPSKDEKIAPGQEEAKPKKPSAAEERMRKLIETIKEERPATKEEIAAEEQLMQEITGLIIEETMTKIGYDFYEYFFLLWKPPETELKYYNIVITERASPMWGSLVEIKIRDNTVWNRMLRPRSEEIEDAAKEAIEVTKNYLQNYQIRQFKSPDLMGTGI